MTARNDTKAGRQVARRLRPATVWYGAMMAAGLAFGLLGDRRPFGDDVFAHPLAVYALTAGAALLAIRIVTSRPVPEIIPERVMLRGFLLGLGLFLAGNLIVSRIAFV
jgi:hypothetical protein